MTATVRREELREQVAALGAEVIAPEGFAEHGPFDVILELVGAPNMPENLQRARDRRADRRDRRLRRREDRAEPARADGQARAHPRLDAARAAAGGESDRRARAGARGAAAVRRPARCACRSPQTFPLEEAAAAYERFAAGGKLGKIVLTV